MRLTVNSCAAAASEADSSPLFSGNETTGSWGDHPEFAQTYSVLGLFLLHGHAAETNATRLAIAHSTLVADLKAKDYGHRVGLIGWAHLLPVLSLLGEHEVAAKVASSMRWPSLGYMLAQTGDGSTLWERWERPDPDERRATTVNNTSLNHPMFGSVLPWLMASAAGLDASRAALDGRLTLRPQPTVAVSGAAAVQVLADGRGSVARLSWRLLAGGKDGATVEINCSVPEGYAADVEGVAERFSVGAGEHSFRVALADMARQLLKLDDSHGERRELRATTQCG